jgi:hypothetical protein
MKRLRLLLLFLAIGGLVSLPIGAQPTGRENPMEMLRSSVIVSAEDEAKDAHEMATLINEAINVRREVVITLDNGTTVIVGGWVTVQRYWLTVPLQDRSEIRFRASMIASVKLK